MEALYSKLYDKYTKLKEKKESEIDKINRDQEVRFMTYVSAADELVEHLRNENDKLRAQIDDLRSEAASTRSAMDDQHTEYQKLLMEENQKNANLSEEIERLRNLQREGFCCSTREDKIEKEQLNMSRSSQVGADTFNDLDVNVTRKRSRYYETAAEVTVTPCASDQLEHTAVSDLSKKTMSSGTGLIIDQPECCRRKIDCSGGCVNVTGPANCIFQDLIECLVGMKLSIVTQTDGMCVSAVHQSSGYSFSLTLVNKSGGEETELLYRVLSLGTFERVAPEWMREVLMFSMGMCPVFFERVSRVIKIHR